VSLHRDEKICWLRLSFILSASAGTGLVRGHYRWAIRVPKAEQTTETADSVAVRAMCWAEAVLFISHTALTACKTCV